MDLEAAVLAAFPDFEIDEDFLADSDNVFRLPFEFTTTTASTRDWELPMTLIAISRSWKGSTRNLWGSHLCEELMDRLYLAVLTLCPEENTYFYKARDIHKIIQREAVILIKDCTREHLILLIDWAKAYQEKWGEWDEEDKLGAIIRCLSARAANPSPG